MRQRPAPVDKRVETSYFKIDDDLLRRIRNSRVVILRAVCDGKWSKTRVALLENTKEGSRSSYRTIEVELEMTLSQFYDIIRRGGEIVFYKGTSLDVQEGSEVLFIGSGEPLIHEGAKAVFRMDKIVCNDGFRSKNPLSDGPERDME